MEIKNIKDKIEKLKAREAKKESLMSEAEKLQFKLMEDMKYNKSSETEADLLE